MHYDRGSVWGFTFLSYNSCTKHIFLWEWFLLDRCYFLYYDWGKVWGFTHKNQSCNSYRIETYHIFCKVDVIFNCVWNFFPLLQYLYSYCTMELVGWCRGLVKGQVRPRSVLRVVWLVVWQVVGGVGIWIVVLDDLWVDLGDGVEAAPPASFKMDARGLQNGRRDL